MVWKGFPAFPAHLSVQLLATPWTVAYKAPPIHGILQARVLEWVAIAFSTRSFRTNTKKDVLFTDRSVPVWLGHKSHPSPSHPSGSSQCSSPEYPVSCIKPGLAIYFTYDNIHVSMLFSQIILLSPSPTESKSLFFTFVPGRWPARCVRSEALGQGAL